MYILQYTMTETIELDNQIHLHRFNYNLPHPSYIAGFIDGDGCVFIRKIENGYQSGIQIAQSRTNVLQILRFHFGGSITSSSNRNNKIENLMDDIDEYYHKYNIRNQYNLLIRSNEYQLLINYLQNSFIIKENQYKLLYEFNKLANLPNKNEEKEKLYLKCSSLNKDCNLDEIYLIRLNIEYISGLFDAEGCIFIDHNLKNIKISIAQKNHSKILQEIVKFLEFGKVKNYEFKIHKKSDCLKFLQIVKPFVIVKYNQVVAFETFLQTDDPKMKEEMYKTCNREKHQIEHFTDLNQSKEGKKWLLRINEIERNKRKSM